MGYNMRILEPPTAYPENTVSHTSGVPKWFRMNRREMSLMREIMSYAGVLNLRSRPTPFPSLPSGMPQARLLELLAFVARGEQPSIAATPVELCHVQQYKHKMDCVMRGTTWFQWKVPSYKFSSTAGWVILPKEASLIAAKLQIICQRLLKISQIDRQRLGLNCEKASQEERNWLDWVGAWVTFNATAAKCGGYQVG